MRFACFLFYIIASPTGNIVQLLPGKASREHCEGHLFAYTQPTNPNRAYNRINNQKYYAAASMFNKKAKMTKYNKLHKALLPFLAYENKAAELLFVRVAHGACKPLIILNEALPKTPASLPHLYLAPRDLPLSSIN